ncbi:serine/threonine-protein kinase [Ornithinimicrobium cerasi]|uniref:non-specific serine/threonine protein kinase n=1 Tax=Ornithinimicrobium cerasi TaxID=2248773 RepID=A0A285VJX0_9MICO|nr:serine/threonine-protein kinase [Ornithinimicrobium cerasi]SOC54385.1 Protein kinase domain-containing protein [Ornithinimicrobium cerasi]
MSVIATGGMGVVWKGWDARLERPVAIKQLRPAPNLPDAEAEMAKDRAMREARITGRLQHPHAVPVFDAVEHDGQPCLIMPFVVSTTLSAMLGESGPLSLARVARVGAEVASALAAAHRLEIVHRDVKPGNILITGDGAAHISDFGISHAMGDATLTSTGLIHGTPAYLAPEVARGETAGFPSDVFSLGSTLFAALEGAPPFGTDPNSIALLHKVAAARVPYPARAGGLTSFLLEMLSSDPRSRPSMDEVASVLADYVTYAQVDDDPAALRASAAGSSLAVPAAGADATEAQALAVPQETGTPTGQADDEEPSSALWWWFSTRAQTSPTPAGHVGGGPATRGPAPDAATEMAHEPVSRVEPLPATAQSWGDGRSDSGAGRAGSSFADSAQRPSGAVRPGQGTASVVDRRPAARWRRPSRSLLLAAAALVAIVIASGALFDNLRREPPSGEEGRAPATAVSAPSPAAEEATPPRVLPTPSPVLATPSASAPAPASSAEVEPESEPTASPAPAPQPSSQPSAEPEPEPAPEPEPEPEPSAAPDLEPAPADRATQLASAISDYYALMPDNTDAGWDRMTADYRTNHAGGFASYAGFWSDVADVAISDVQATPPDGVVATLTYYFVDGGVAVERTAYRLVDEGGLPKIAASEVLSSRSG